MDGNTKRILVIKDIPSNFIEEAILILKSEAGPGKDKAQESIVNKNAKKVDNDFLIKEAEMIINNYIKECKKRGIYTDTTGEKPGILKNKFKTNMIINSALVGSIAFLIFVLTKLL